MDFKGVSLEKASHYAFIPNSHPTPVTGASLCTEDYSE